MQKKIYSLLKMNPFDNINKKNVKTVNKGKLSAKNYQLVENLYQTQLLSGKQPDWNEISKLIDFPNPQKLKQLHRERVKNRQLTDKEKEILFERIQNFYKNGVKQIDYTILGDQFQMQPNIVQKTYEQYEEQLLKQHRLLNATQIKQIINDIQTKDKVKWIDYQQIYGYQSGKIYKAVIQYLQEQIKNQNTKYQDILDKIYKPKVKQ